MRTWEEFLQKQTAVLGKEVVTQWLLPLKVTRFDACNLYLEAADTFQLMWFEEHIRPKLKGKTFCNPNGALIKVHLAVANQPVVAKKEKFKKSDSTEKSQNFSLNFETTDPLCKLSNFSSGPPNQLAFKLLTTISQHSIGKSVENDSVALGTFNPIYLYGRSGTGKTHLLSAITHALSAAGLRALYARADTFTEHVISAMRAGQMHTFRQAYRNIDLLVLDDVHQFARKTATQEELFHTFNTLHTAGKQIIMSAACAPAELQHIEPRLISRFEWGIALELFPIQGKEYGQILHYKCDALNFPLSQRTAAFLLETFSTNAKTLIRALEALILRTHISSSQIGSIPSLTLTLPQVRHYLEDLIREEQSTAITSDKILHHVAEHYGIKIIDLLGKAQSRDCSLPRQLAVYLCRQLLKMPYKQIGDLFSRDHSTIITSVKLVKKHLDTENRDVISALRQVQNALARQTSSPQTPFTLGNIS